MRKYEQFLQDIEFIKQHNDNWIFKPLYDITRRLILFYEEFYDEVLK